VKNRSVKMAKLDRFIALINFIFSIVSVTGYFSTALALVFQGFSSIVHSSCRCKISMATRLQPEKHCYFLYVLHIYFSFCRYIQYNYYASDNDAVHIRTQKACSLIFVH
jgi:hypothetical protein